MNNTYCSSDSQTFQLIYTQYLCRYVGIFLIYLILIKIAQHLHGIKLLYKFPYEICAHFCNKNTKSVLFHEKLVTDPTITF